MSKGGIVQSVIMRPEQLTFRMVRLDVVPRDVDHT